MGLVFSTSTRKRAGSPGGSSLRRGFFFASCRRDSWCSVMAFPSHITTMQGIRRRPVSPPWGFFIAYLSPALLVRAASRFPATFQRPHFIGLLSQKLGTNSHCV